MKVTLLLLNELTLESLQYQILYNQNEQNYTNRHFKSSQQIIIVTNKISLANIITNKPRSKQLETLQQPRK